MNFVNIFRLNKYKFAWEFSLNLTLGFNVASLCFGTQKYLAVVGSQLTIWEEKNLESVENAKNQDNKSSSSAWFNVCSNAMPRPFENIKFSPCETMFVTSEVIATCFVRI